MRIAQILTYISEDGAFGGPVSVAASQAQELAARGHDVEVLAGWDGKVDFRVPGVHVRLFRVRRVLPNRFSGLVAPGLRKHVRDNLRTYDVAHVHLARDLITLPASKLLAERGSVPFFVQSHGMVTPDPRLRARVFDAIAVRKVLRSASAAIAYAGVDDKWIREVAKSEIPVLHLRNGAEHPVTWEERREWPTRPQVIFLARLHPRKRVLAFAEMARLLLGEGSDWDFRIVGPDQGDLEELRAFIELHSLSKNIHYEGPLPLDQVRSRLQAASVFVLPSVNEPFPVTVLDALATQTPIVMTDSSGISPILRRLSAATVTDGSPASLARAVRELIEDEKLRDARAAAGLSAIRTELGISAVVDRLENYYRDALERAREPHRNRKGG